MTLLNLSFRLDTNDAFKILEIEPLNADGKSYQVRIFTYEFNSRISAYLRRKSGITSIELLTSLGGLYDVS